MVAASHELTLAALNEWLDGASKEAIVAKLRVAVVSQSTSSLAHTALTCFGEYATKKGSFAADPRTRQQACIQLGMRTKRWMKKPKPLGLLYTETGSQLIDVAALPVGGDQWWCTHFVDKVEDVPVGYRTTSSAELCAVGRAACALTRASLGELGKAYTSCSPMHRDYQNIAKCLTFRGVDGKTRSQCGMECVMLQRQLRLPFAREVSECVDWDAIGLPVSSRPFDAVPPTRLPSAAPQPEVVASSLVAPSLAVAESGPKATTFVGEALAAGQRFHIIDVHASDPNHPDQVRLASEVCEVHAGAGMTRSQEAGYFAGSAGCSSISTGFKNRMFTAVAVTLVEVAEQWAASPPPFDPLKASRFTGASIPSGAVFRVVEASPADTANAGKYRGLIGRACLANDELKSVGPGWFSGAADCGPTHWSKDIINWTRVAVELVPVAGPVPPRSEGAAAPVPFTAQSVPSLTAFRTLAFGPKDPWAGLPDKIGVGCVTRAHSLLNTQYSGRFYKGRAWCGGVEVAFIQVSLELVDATTGAPLPQRAPRAGLSATAAHYPEGTRVRILSTSIRGPTKKEDPANVAWLDWQGVGCTASSQLSGVPSEDGKRVYQGQISCEGPYGPVSWAAQSLKLEVFPPPGASAPEAIPPTVATGQKMPWISRDDHEGWTGITRVGTTWLASTREVLLRSTDDGLNWSPSGTGVTTVGNFKGLATFGGKVFVGTSSDGLFRSSDEGRSWTRALKLVSVEAVVAGQSALYVGTSEGRVYATKDGEKWKALCLGLPNTTTVKSFAEVAGGVLVATTDGLFFSHASTCERLPERVGALASQNGAVVATLNACAVAFSVDGRRWTTVDAENCGKDATFGLMSLVTSERAVLVSTDVGHLRLYRDRSSGSVNVNPFEGGMNSPAVVMALSGSTLIAGGNGKGLWRHVLDAGASPTSLVPSTKEEWEALLKPQEDACLGGKLGACNDAAALVLRQLSPERGLQMHLKGCALKGGGESCLALWNEMFNAERFHLKTLPVKVDTTALMAGLEAHCKAGSSEGCAARGTMHLFDQLIGPYSPPKALPFLVKGCQAKVPSARACAEATTHLPEAKSAASTLRACEWGHSGSCDRLDERAWSPASVSEALGALQKGCAAGADSACRKLTNSKFRDPHLEGVRPWLERLCLEDASACDQLALALLQGKGTPKDPVLGLHWLEAACDGGVATSCNYAASLNELGDGVPVDRSRGAALRRRAGQLFEEGCQAGAKKDCVKACELGRAGACTAKP